MSGLLQLTTTSNNEIIGLRRGFTADSLRLESCEIVFQNPGNNFTSNTSTHASIDIDFLEGYNISNENASSITMALEIDTTSTNRLNRATFQNVDYRRIPIRDSIHVRIYDADGEPLPGVASCVVTFSYREAGR